MAVTDVLASGSYLDRPRRDERRWTGWIFTVAVFAAIAAAGWVQAWPQHPDGHVPTSYTAQLVREHDCLPPLEWTSTQGLFPSEGALLRSVDGAEVVWVPAGEATRWQPDWWLVQWCVR